MSRSNEEWTASLATTGPNRDAALAELRDLLLRNTRKALASHPRADGALLEDAVQDALVKILEQLHQFEGRSRFTTWATTIAVHAAIGELRRRRWKDVSLDDVTGDESTVTRSIQPVEGGPGPREQIEQSALLTTLSELMETALSDRQRTALTAELRGMPQDEIAVQLETNRNALYKLTHDARKKLKAGLEAAGYGIEDLQAFAT